MFLFSLTITPFMTNLDNKFVVLWAKVLLNVSISVVLLLHFPGIECG